MAKVDAVLAKYKPGCLCTGIKLHTIIQAIDDGAGNFDEISRRTGIGTGSCGGIRCGKVVADLLSE